MKTSGSSGEQPALVTVEINHGGDPLLTAVREALTHLPVRVEPVTRTTGRTRS